MLNLTRPRRYLTKQHLALLKDLENSESIERILEDSSPPLLSTLNAHPRDCRIEFYDKILLPGETKEREHIYIVDGDANKYWSCTEFIHHFVNPFDSDKIITGMMAKPNWPDSQWYGMTPDEIKDAWEKNRNEASDKGTLMHAQLENYYNGIPVTLEFTESKEWQYFGHYLDEYPDFEPFRTEWRVFDEEHFLAGSIDMVYKDPNDPKKLMLGDWKRSKEIKRFGYKRCLEPLQNLHDCNYQHYSLQLNMYKYILEKNYGVQISRLFLIIIHPNQDSFELINIRYMPNEIAAILSWRKDYLKKLTLTDSKRQSPVDDEPEAKRVKIE